MRDTPVEIHTAEMRHPSVSIVIVSYDSAGVVDAINSVASWAEVVVVEQHPVSTAAERAGHARDGARVIRAGRNRGFGAGCNLGAANAQGEILVFLNPDAAIDDRSLRDVANTALDPSAGLVGPRILDQDLREDTRARNWSTPMVDSLHLVFPRKLIPRRWARDIPPSDTRYAGGGNVPYVQGCCMAISRQLFFDVGGFDERFFLYGEEEDLARRLQSRDRPCRLVTSATASHIGATSTANVNAFATRQLFRSHLLIYRKHGGILTSVVGAVMLTLALALLLITAPLRAATPWRKRESPAWCVDALRGVRDGLFGLSVVPPKVSCHQIDREPWPSTG
jgi:N-acetylglucosaminyl-diphospho-decaprenol L-rhamnosyltransferase